MSIYGNVDGQSSTLPTTITPYAEPRVGPATQGLFGIPSDPKSGLTADDKAWKARHSGIAGVARDILGGLGDFLLSRLHMPTMYGDSQKQSQFNYAFDQGGNSADPTQQMNGVNEVQKVDFATGAKLRDQLIDNQRLDVAQQGTAESRDARIAAQAEIRRKDVKDRAASYFNSLAGDPKDVESGYANGRALWGNSTAVKNDPQLQADLNDLYPAEYNPNKIASSISASVPVATQWAQHLTDKRIDNQDEQAGATLGENKRNHDLQHKDRVSQQGVTLTGQQIVSGDKAASREVTLKGQASAAGSKAAATAETTRHHKKQESRYVQEGSTSELNGRYYIILNGKPAEITKSEWEAKRGK